MPLWFSSIPWQISSFNFASLRDQNPTVAKREAGIDEAILDLEAGRHRLRASSDTEILVWTYYGNMLSISVTNPDPSIHTFVYENKQRFNFELMILTNSDSQTHPSL
jgi:hypothetical protein